ncbi:hypothetical protein FB565_008226 [Actinoplanes lutulentus]|uniref:T6SS immunity protein Tdi1 C-terminal domain-containing protein n=1 Tax=Actinoplanes lutulentus TaxID=1287878 RepID=A0A327ZG76_9ACTN|nr:hypothetical protein [Actinoplanes lutulentus]MBB2948443.1 hypothetical protein [Actinoplanes lutulentus]RAK34524.1 hypothetical protein B0I29_111123 [Actinoplanes lutulentus]
MELTKTFTEEQYAAALASWSWLDLHGKTPRFTSLFGDVFLEAEDGTWWQLNTFEGELFQEWPDTATLAAVLNTEDGQDQFLLGGLAMAAFHRRRLRLGGDDIYAWAPPPIVTDSFSVDEIAVFGFVAVVSTAGQFHQQIRAGAWDHGHRDGSGPVDGEAGPYGV